MSSSRLSLVLSGALLLAACGATPPTADVLGNESLQASFTGTTECVPLKEGAVSETCTFGLATVDGRHVAVDLTTVASPDLSVGVIKTYEGTYTSIDQINVEYWQKFNVAGVLSVTAQ